MDTSELEDYPDLLLEYFIENLVLLDYDQLKSLQYELKSTLDDKLFMQLNGEER